MLKKLICKFKAMHDDDNNNNNNNNNTKALDIRSGTKDGRRKKGKTDVEEEQVLCC